MSAKYVVPPVKEIDGFKVLNLTFSQDVEVVHSITPVPDLDWVYQDERGHHHFWDDSPGHWALPTLEYVVTTTYYCETCRDTHKEGEYRCRKCGEVVEPGTKPPDPFGTPIKMPMEIHLEIIGEGPEVLRGEVEGQNLRFQKVGSRGGFDWMVSEYVGMPDD